MIDEYKVNTEVRIQLLERIADSIDKRFEHLENKIDASVNSLRKDMETNFRWTLSIIIGVFLGSVVAKFFG
jgi:F0F1-type ATP synthase assembly protein I